MDALYGSTDTPMEVREGNDWLFLVALPAHDTDEAEQIEKNFLATIAQRNLHVVRFRSDYCPAEVRVSLVARVVPPDLIHYGLGRVCYRG